LPAEFLIFGVTLAGVALFHRRALPIAAAGLAAVIAYEWLFATFPAGPGLTGLAAQLAHEWVILANLFLLLVGFARVFWFEKGATYYFHSHAFLTKFALFILMALLSIVPTIEFLSWRKAVEAGQVPVVAAAKLKRVRMIVHIELAAIVLILLCAAMMAKGGWV